MLCHSIDCYLKFVDLGIYLLKPELNLKATVRGSLLQATALLGRSKIVYCNPNLTLKQLTQEGYDSVEIHGRWAMEYVVYDPAQVKNNRNLSLLVQ